MLRGDEILQGRSHPVAWAAFARGIPHMSVETAFGEESGLAACNPASGARLSVRLRNVIDRVVTVASPVRPTHVVKDEDRPGRVGLVRLLLEELELVVNGVPVVIAVDEGEIDE